MNTYEEMRLKMIANAMTFSSKSLAGLVRENKSYLNRLVALYKRHRHEDGYKGSVYSLISEVLASCGVYQKNGQKVSVEQLTTVFARLRKEEQLKNSRRK